MQPILKNRWFAQLSLLCLAACGNSTEVDSVPPDTSAGAEARICDGSSRLRFGTWLPVLVTRIAAGSAVMDDLGRHWLYVDGQCRYWVHPNNEPGDLWRATREGILTEDEERQLISDFSYADWSLLSKVWHGAGAATDSSIEVFFDGTNAVGCSACCNMPPMPDPGIEKVCAMSERRLSLVYDLYERGHDVTGPMRLTTYPGIDPREAEPVDHTPEHIESFEWPANTPLEDIAITWEKAERAGFGSSYLLDEEAAVSELRKRRMDLLNGELGPIPWAALVTTPRDSKGEIFSLLARYDPA